MGDKGFFTNNNPHLNKEAATVETEPVTQVSEPTPTEPKTEQNTNIPPKENAINSNKSSFLDNISKPRQAVAEPPKEEPKPETPPQTEEGEEEETDKAEPISKEGLGLTAEFIVETEDLLIPELMAHFDPDEDAEAEDYEVKDKHKKYLIASWKRYLDDIGVNMTPGQQLIAAHVGAYGMPLAVMGLHKFLKWKKEAKLKEKESEALNQNAELLKQMQEMQKQLREAQNQNQQTAAPENENRQTVNVETPQDNNVTLKPCINPDCDTKFTPGTGFAKNKKSDLYDTACSRKCMNKVIGQRGGAKKKK